MNTAFLNKIKKRRENEEKQEKPLAKVKPAPEKEKPRPALMIHDIGFDIATQNVILTDMKANHEIARFNANGVGSSIRDYYRRLS